MPDDTREWGPIAFKGADHAVVNEAMACTFDEWMESTENIMEISGGADQNQPHPLKIQYVNPDGGVVEELVFEDPEDRNGKDVGARLLVSKDAVLDLKKLCEREFGRVETLSRMLNSCRCAYYKELLYLREQLIIASQPQNVMKWDWVRNYEVYWFNPPKYCDGELCDFLKDCIRLTHKKIIEENYELTLKLQGKDVADLNADPDMQIKRMFRQMGGPGRLLKRMHFILNSRDGAEPGQLEEFMKAIGDLAPQDDPGTPVSDRGPEDLKKQLHELRGKLGQMDNMRRQLKETTEELEKTKALVEQNAKRAAAEAERAEAERARAEALEEELANVRTSASKPDPKLQIAEQRILSVISSMDKQAGSWTNSQVQSMPGAKVGNMDATVAGLEKAVKGLLTSVPKPKAAPAPKGTVVQTKEVIVEKTDPKDAERIKLLESQLQKAQQDRDAARAQLTQLENQLQQTEGRLAAELDKPAPVIVKKPDTPPPPPREKEKEPEPVRIIQKGTDPAIVKELEHLRKLRQEWDAEREKLEGKFAKMEDRLKKQAEKFEADLQAERDAAVEREAKQRDKLKRVEEELEEMGMKLTKTQEKLAVTKEELNRYKRAAGEKVVDSDDDDSDDTEDGVPRFLIRYFRRVKNNPKPRWMHLSEDASLADKKRRWLVSKKYPSYFGASDVKQAFNFLKGPAQEMKMPAGGGKKKRPGALMDQYMGMEGDGGHFPPVRPGSNGQGMWVWVPTGPGSGGPGSPHSGAPGSPTSRSPSPSGGALKARRNSGDPRSMAHASAAASNFTSLAQMPGERPAGGHAPQDGHRAAAIRKRTPSPPPYLQPPQPHGFNETFALGAMSITSAAASAHSAAALAVAASQQQHQQQMQAAAKPRSRSPPRLPRQQQHSGAVGPNDTLIAHVAALSGFALLPQNKIPAPAPVRQPEADRAGRAPVVQRREEGSSRHASPSTSPTSGTSRRILLSMDPSFSDQGPRSPSPGSPGRVAKGFAGVLPIKGSPDPEPAKLGTMMSTATIGEDLQEAIRGRSGSPTGALPMRQSPVRGAMSPNTSPERPSSRSRERDRQSEPGTRDGSSKGKKLPSTLGELLQSEFSPEAAALADSLRGRPPAASDEDVRPRRLHSEFAKTLDTPLSNGMSKLPSKPAATSGSLLSTGDTSMNTTAKTFPLVGEKPPSVAAERSPPPPVPAMVRDGAMIAARSMAKRSGSTGMLPLTNVGIAKVGVGGALVNPVKPRRSGGISGTMGRSTESGPFASASYSTLSSDGFLPEVLPPLPHQKIKKAPPQPSWMKPSY